MAWRHARWPALAAAAAVLALADLPGQPSGPAAQISVVDVLAVVMLLATLPPLVRRRYGPVGDSRLARLVRVAGCMAMLGLILAKAAVQRSEYAKLSGPLWLAGIWVGECIFLVVLAAYLAAILAVTSRRPPATRAAVAVGAAAGGLAGLVMYMLPPRGSALHISSSWLAAAYGAARVLAVPIVLAAGVVAGVKAARRTSRHSGKRSIVEARTRQGVAAGVAAGAAAALTVSILGISTIALVPHEATVLQWTLPIEHHLPPGTVYQFEVSLSGAAAGFLFVLLFFPLLGAGLGAWGGMFAVDPPRRRPDDGGGGGRGPKTPDVKPPPPEGGRDPDETRTQDAGRRLLSLPEWRIPPDAGKEPVTPRRREKTPSGGPG